MAGRVSRERELLMRWLEGGLLNNSVYVPLLKETKELLAQPEQEQETVAWKETIIELFQSVFDSEMLCTAEGEALIRLEDAICYVEELVMPTHDQPEQPTRNPLSYEHLEALADEYEGCPMMLGRAVEKAHGITGVVDE